MSPSLYCILLSICVSQSAKSYPVLVVTFGAYIFNTCALFGFTNKTFLVIIVDPIVPFPLSTVSKVTLIYPSGFCESSSAVLTITSGSSVYCALTTISAGPVICVVSLVSQASGVAFCFQPVSALTVGFVISAIVLFAFGFTK